MPIPDGVLAGSYDPGLVIASVLISIIGASAALTLGGRVAAARGSTRLAWLIGGAAASGINTWSMHYIGMQAFSLPVPIQYHWPTALLSLLPALFTAAIGLFVVSRARMGLLQAIVASVFVGGGIAALHYTAMVSMRMPAMCSYSPTGVILSVLFAILLSFVPFRLIFLFRGRATGQKLSKAASVLLMGAANPFMHYTGMAAATFTRSSAPPDFSHAVRISTLGTAAIITVPLMVLGVAALTSVADRLREQKALLAELFEQAPQAVALMNADNRVVRVNREFSRIFGYAPQETLGHALSDLIVPDDLREEDQRYWGFLIQGRRVDAVSIRMRKDATRLHVSMVHVPVSVPGGQVAVYASYRDITAEKHAEDRLKATSEQLRALSMRLQFAIEQERTRIAREIHDELGSALTVLGWSLEELDKIFSQPGSQPSTHELREKLTQMIALVDTTINSVRRIASELRPSILDDLGLIEAIDWQAQQFQARTGIVCHCDYSLEEVHLHRDQSTAVFRILQEALTNVLRHAQATKIDISMKQEAGEFILSISDNGRGIREDEKSNQMSLGLLGMQERAHLVGGKVEIAGIESTGTVVTVRIPLSNA